MVATRRGMTLIHDGKQRNKQTKLTQNVFLRLRDNGILQKHATKFSSTPLVPTGNENCAFV